MIYSIEAVDLVFASDFIFIDNVRVGAHVTPADVLQELLLIDHRRPHAVDLVGSRDVDDQEGAALTHVPDVDPLHRVRIRLVEPEPLSLLWKHRSKRRRSPHPERVQRERLARLEFVVRYALRHIVAQFFLCGQASHTSDHGRVQACEDVKVLWPPRSRQHTCRIAFHRLPVTFDAELEVEIRRRQLDPHLQLGCHRFEFLAVEDAPVVDPHADQLGAVLRSIQNPEVLQEIAGHLPVGLLGADHIEEIECLVYCSEYACESLDHGFHPIAPVVEVHALACLRRPLDRRRGACAWCPRLEH